MTDEQANPPLSIVEQLKAETRRKTASVPPDRKFVTVVAVDWKWGVPTNYRFGTAVRVGDHFELSAEAETKFSKASTNASVHAVWSW